MHSFVLRILFKTYYSMNTCKVWIIFNKKLSRYQINHYHTFCISQIASKYYFYFTATKKTYSFSNFTTAVKEEAKIFEHTMVQ